jgi:hypothetical protein
MPDASGQPAPAGAVSAIEAVIRTYFDGCTKATSRSSAPPSTP